ncbi:hypothetical protein HHK36_027874 [Tetracentron sinense]|uniref:Cytochrome P450 n=1 Tax=Tetracentron sinense TaxID=13715 RepID=A0A834YFK9_TETSI|nr:hypothetical protein HHK36_027874 [Tetracentron sinense]
MNSGSGKLPPGPVPLPVIGSLLKLGNRPHRSLAELAKTYGPLMTLKLGRLTTVVVSSSSMAKEVLQKNDLAFANRTIPDAIRALNHHEVSMVWLPVSARWRSLRKICNGQMFTTQRLDANQGLRQQKVQELLAHVRDSCKAGKAVDVGRAAFSTTLNLMWNTLFSIDMAQPNSDTAQEFKDLVWGMMEEIARPNIADFFPVLRMIDPQGIRRRLSIYFGKLFEVFDGMIDQRLKSRASPTYLTSNDLLDTLLNHWETSFEIGRPDIQHLLLDIFGAGTDTTSNTLEWVMAELLHNPDTMTKAREELEQIIGKDNLVEESDIARLPYLQAVVKETFRLHPTVPLLLPYKAETNVEICGLTVPKNAQVFVNVWAIGRDPSIWENPNSFVPERFLGSEIDVRGRHFELIPFGAGRRICPGMPLALRMLHLMLASLLHSFDWKLEDGMTPKDMDMGDKFGLTLQKAEPLLAVPIKM